METLFKILETIPIILFFPARALMGHPERAYLIAIGFAILFAVSVLQSGAFNKSRHHFLLLFVTFLWVVFGLNEQQQGQVVGAIRVDLVFFWPFLFLISIAAAWAGILDIVAGKSKSESKGPGVLVKESHHIYSFQAQHRTSVR